MPLLFTPTHTNKPRRDSGSWWFFFFSLAVDHNNFQKKMIAMRRSRSYLSFSTDTTLTDHLGGDIVHSNVLSHVIIQLFCCMWHCGFLFLRHCGAISLAGSFETISGKHFRIETSTNKVPPPGNVLTNTVHLTNREVSCTYMSVCLFNVTKMWATMYSCSKGNCSLSKALYVNLLSILSYF